MKAKPNIRNRYVMMGDLILIVATVLGSYVLRLELSPAFYTYLPSAMWLLGASLIIKPLVYYFFGLYRRMWLYASVPELKLILAAVTSASVLVSTVLVGMFSMGVFTGFPRSVLVIDWLLTLLTVGGLRFTMRLVAEYRINAGQNKQGSQGKRILIIGAGDAGAMVVRELQKNLQLNLYPIGFLDDNPAKQNQQIYGVPVIGTLTDLAVTLERRSIDEVIIAIPSAPGRVVRLVANVCRIKGTPFRTMPGIYELLGGIVSISRLREVQITDLLRRETVSSLFEEVGATLGGKAIAVTGAGGSIGREICRQVARWGPSELILIGHGENSIFESVLELHDSFPSLLIRPLICDVRDYQRLNNLFQRHHPELVFHAAAHKHVPLMETNVEEAITNNILGSRNVVNVCLEHDIEKLVMISTDKAVRPINVMGATKRMAELMVLDAAHRYNKAYSVVRFGNVLGSRGSVVPLFKRQIAQGGPITITHPDMKRYFMTIPEAVHLVLQAASMEGCGETYVLNMGQQVRILDLAEDLIRLSGLEPGKDIEIVFTGIRAGEKLSEDLWDEGNRSQSTPHPDIRQAERHIELSGKELSNSVDELIKLAREGEPTAIIHLLDELIPDAKIRSTPPQEITTIY
ncbi:MAG: polysaccharide biosynthesis protein [Anaerolineaceae bacterium]|nr:polysaccharide biosynthesis protein [Anaerolineaceae bacterium]